MYRFSIASSCVVMALLLSASVAFAQAANDPEIVVQIGDSETITRTELERALTAILQARVAQAQNMGIKDPERLAQQPISQDEKLKIIDTMVDGKVLYVLAKEAGVEVTDEEVKAEIDRNAAALPNGATMEEFIAKQGISMEEVQDLTRMRLVSRKFSQMKAADVTVSDEEIQAEYENLKAKNMFDVADIAHILVRVQDDDPAAGEQAREKIDAAYKRIQDGEDFASVAKEVTDDDRTRETGGVIQGATRGILGPEFDQRMFDAPLNEVSQPFKTRVGWHIMKVTDRKTAPLEGELKERLSNAMVQRKKQQIIEDLVNEARSTMSIQISLPPDAPAGGENAPVQSPSLLEGAT